jgi:hypothetical protein
MALDQRIESLKKQHAHIDDKIHQTQIRLSADDLEVRGLKRQKLNIKDEIVRLAGIQEAA